MSMECEKKKAPIGVFDSGVGGLTVVRGDNTAAAA